MTHFNTKKHNYPDDEVKSALQKEIRRGNEEEAMYYALELAHEGKPSFGWLRNRLKIICHEDIGLANPDVVMQVSKAIDDMDYLYQKNNDEWQMVLGHIILLMCRSGKSRLVDHFKESSLDNWHNNTLQIPDYAKDMHTTSGSKMGRRKGIKKGIDHFIKHGEKANNYVAVRGALLYQTKAHDYWHNRKQWR